MEKMEKVETLRKKAGVTYEEAKAALEANNWDVLDALIALEKEGKVKQAYTATKAEVLTGDVVTENGQKSSSEPKRRKFMNWVKDILRKANRNAFEISKDGKIILTVPVLVFVIVLLFAFHIVIPLMIIGLFFSIKYHFSGPDVHSVDVDINAAMDSASRTAENLKNEFTSNEKKEA